MSKWVASLSNGQRLSEEHLEKDGKTAWTNLRQFLKDNKDVELIQMQLIVNGKYYNSPSRSQKARFSGEDVKDLFACRKKDIDFIGGYKEDNWISFSYRVGEYRHYLWINEVSNNSYVEVMKIKDSIESAIVI